MNKYLTREKILLLLILLAAAFLRFWNIGWGLPDILEEATPVVKANAMWNWAGHGVDLDPHFFNYPALTFYIMFIVQGIQYCVGHLLGFFPDMHSFGATLSNAMIPARIVIGLFDIATIVLAYRFAKEFTTETTALICAALIALNPLHILQSQYITVDTPLTFFILLALYCIYRTYRRSSTKHYVIAGMCIGLATATKYTGAFLLLVLLILHLLRSNTVSKAIESLIEKRLILSVAATVVVFFLLNPYIVLNYDRFKRDFSFEQYHVAEGHLGIDTSQSTVDYYLFDALPSNLGLILAAFIPLVVIYWIVKKEKDHLLLLLFPVIYFIIISTWEMRVERYLLPIIPLLLLVCAIGIKTIWDRMLPTMQSAGVKKLRPGIACVIGLAFIAQPVATVYDFQRSIVIPDTRTVAKQWIEQNVEPGSFIVSGPFGIQIPESTYHTLYIPFLMVDVEGVAPFYDTRWYEDLELIIASDFDYARYAKDTVKYAHFMPYYDSLKTRWKLVGEITPQEHQRGPAIRFYTYPDSLRRAMYDPALFARLHETPESAKVSYFLNNLSVALAQKKMLEKSEQVLREILSVEVENLKARNSLARVLFKLENYQGALLQVQKSLRSNPDQAELFSFAGDILQKLGRSTDAEMSYLKAIEVNKWTPSAYRALIALYDAQNTKPKLISILEQYGKILPPNSNEAREIAARVQELKASS
ncbi:MAG TPA: glycosyltransferase family 39 protein [Bacteroidota bacterium]|nr:glycosyltransferase family 39 protein [Bacteroidota bacterium]